LIGSNLRQLLHSPGRPMDFQRSTSVRSQTEVNSQVAGRCITDTAGDSANLRPLRGSTNHPCPNGGPVAASARQLHLQPVLDRTAIHPQFDGFIDRGYSRIDATVVIEVGKRHTAMQTRGCEIGAHPGGCVSKVAVLIPKHAVRLRFVAIQSTAGDEKVEPAIIVEIDQATTPAAPSAAQAQKAAGRACILECPVAAILKKLVGFATQAGHHDVRTSVAVNVAKIGAHAGDLAAVPVVSDSSLDANLFHSAGYVLEQKIAGIVICDEGVCIAVAVIVANGNTHTLAEYFAQANFASDFGECAVAVIVVIDPCGRDRPQLFPSRAMTTYTSGFRHIGKSTVAIIAVQGVAVNTEDV